MEVLVCPAIVIVIVVNWTWGKVIVVTRIEVKLLFAIVITVDGNTGADVMAGEAVLDIVVAALMTDVETGKVDVTTAVLLAGQFVMLAAQLPVSYSHVFKQDGRTPGAFGAATALKDDDDGEATGEPDAAGPDVDGAVSLELAGMAEELGFGTEVSAAVMGQMVVDTAIVDVTNIVDSAGQLVTVAAQDVIVATDVVYTVDVEYEAIDCEVVAAETSELDQPTLSRETEDTLRCGKKLASVEDKVEAESTADEEGLAVTGDVSTLDGEVDAVVDAVEVDGEELERALDVGDEMAVAIVTFDDPAELVALTVLDVDAGTVLDAAPQLKPMEWILSVQGLLALLDARAAEEEILETLLDALLEPLPELRPLDPP
ncbi:hypothetical protein Tdes44962_MAKER03443 [Teratosphaeria destructans]|uniref:Uncharacterized protein n=1 Tax=Teratosphaeria destructans TaxID=418781 RepID=A0A9W7W1K6_9PEZI|nr:hypothetical protein Tdes44962_MAKER03443 [Teratosphaeria destructans]